MTDPRMIDVQLSEANGEIEQAKAILSRAVRELLASFEHLNHDTHAQKQQVLELIADVSSSNADGKVNIPRFIEDTTAVLGTMTSILTHFSDQAARISAQIQEMAKHTDAIFEMVSRIDAVARETNVLALNATLEASRAGKHGLAFGVVATEVRTLSKSTKSLNDSIGEQVKKTRLTIGALKGAADAMATNDVKVALKAKEDIDGMLRHVRRANGGFERALGDIARFTERVDQSTVDAIRGLQFEDLVAQLLGHLAKRLEVVRTLATEPSLDDQDAEALVDALDKPVEQRSMDKGTLQFF